MQNFFDNTIYLDHNILVDFVNGKSIDKIKELENAYRFCYSSAHLEEINNIRGKNRAQYIEEHLHVMDRVFKKNGLRPTRHNNGPIEINIISEKPRQVLKRVIGEDGEGVKKTEYVVQIQEKIFESIKEKGQDVSSDITFDVMVERIISELPIMVECINVQFPYLAIEHEYSMCLDDQRDREAVIELAFRIVESYKYYQEEKSKSKIKKKASSATHDVSHAVYASVCEYLVSDDQRFVEKCKVIYYALGIQTKVLNFTEFQELTLNNNIPKQ